MDNRTHHIVLQALGLSVSIAYGLASETKHGTVHAVQAGETLCVHIEKPISPHIKYNPAVTFHDISHIPEHALIATIRLIFT